MNDVNPNALIEQAAEDLKSVEKIKAPEWAKFCKTGPHKERPPVKEDWWHFRAAAILRSVAKLGPVGVSKLRTKYGGKKNRGHKPDRFCRASGNIIRKVLQQLEAAELIQKGEAGIFKGRVIAGKGQKILDQAAIKIKKN